MPLKVKLFLGLLLWSPAFFVVVYYIFTLTVACLLFCLRFHTLVQLSAVRHLFLSSAFPYNVLVLVPTPCFSFFTPWPHSRGQSRFSLLATFFPWKKDFSLLRARPSSKRRGREKTPSYLAVQSCTPSKLGQHKIILYRANNTKTSI